jgi:hypothetical protein
MRMLIVLLLVFSSGKALAQADTLSEADLRLQLNAVLEEARLLYKFERAAWVSTDLVMEDPALANRFGGYFVYEVNGRIKAIILDKMHSMVLATYTFHKNFEKPKSSKVKPRPLTTKESELLDMRRLVLKNANQTADGLSAPKGFSLNIIFMPFDNQYKLYVLTGTNQQGVIPFGNDYLFTADQKGTITSWQKFHSRLIPVFIKMDEMDAIEISHSHLPTTPLMTATDICTFRLYAALFNLTTFSVYSTAYRKTFKYHVDRDRITIE